MDMVDSRYMVKKRGGETIIIITLLSFSRFFVLFFSQPGSSALLVLLDLDLFLEAVEDLFLESMHVRIC